LSSWAQPQLCLAARPRLPRTTSAALRYWNIARQRYQRRFGRSRPVPVSLPTARSLQPRIPARKTGLFDLQRPGL
jgi:hypothetical protein